MGLKYPEICKFCGDRVHFIADDSVSAPGSSMRWVIINAASLTLHRCPRSTTRIYTEEEKQEFARKRLAGEI